jgi:hypothetical protein
MEKKEMARKQDEMRHLEEMRRQEERVMLERQQIESMIQRGIFFLNLSLK